MTNDKVKNYLLSCFVTGMFWIATLSIICLIVLVGWFVGFLVGVF